MDPLVWSIILLLAGLLLVVLEVFVPSGGVLGFLSVAAVLASIVTAFYSRGAQTGLVFVMITALAVPAVLVVAFRYWPHTPMGKRVLLEVHNERDLLPDTPQMQALRQLVGKVGVARSMMLPSGAIFIDGRTVDALSEGIAIEPGQFVRVIEVRGNRVVVSPTDERPKLSGESEANDILSRPLESLGLESLEDPLA